ncbi:MAG TPA: FAD-dependent oxidoreductase, partial [Clostridia bacterium]|nr:FAD-dependent oxidoreductase [Clostridia bacterium]
AGLPVPVVAVGKLGYPDIAERALRDGDCDMVMLGRPLLADPEWPNKAYAGKVEDICPCIGCQEGCINEFVEGGHPQCAVNPRTGFEDVIPPAIPAAGVKKRVAVVGAGPAGAMLASIAAKRGHDVELFEKTGSLGGRMVPGGVPIVKFDIENFEKYLADVVDKAKKDHGLKVHLNTAVSVDELKKAKYDSIVFAIGTKNVAPKLPGIEQANTVQATELLVDDKRIGNAKNVVVVGGGAVGCETAYWLKYEKGLNVTVVDMLPYMIEGACTANRGHLIHYLKKADVKLINCARVTSFDVGKVNIKRNVSKGVPDPYNTWQPILPKNIENPLAKKIGAEEREESLDADLVVLAMGGRPDDAMFLEAQEKHAADELHNIGDSFAPGRILEATRAAYRLATTL